MKSFRLLALIAMFTLGLGLSNAQEVAHINTENLLQTMPSMISAKKNIETLLKNHDAELQKMGAQYQRKVTDIQKAIQEKTISEAQAQTKAQEIADLEKRIATYRQSAASEIEKKQKSLLEPIYQKAEKAIKVAAKKKGLKYVMDASPGRGLLVFDGYDLMTDVKSELGIK